MDQQRCPFCHLEKSRIALENDAAVAFPDAFPIVEHTHTAAAAANFGVHVPFRIFLAILVGSGIVVCIRKRQVLTASLLPKRRFPR
jgi:hypothetical protein